MERIIVSGRRKTAVAKAKIFGGTGKIKYNGISHEKLGILHKMALEEPIRIAKNLLGNFNYDIELKTLGGGKESQIEAARLAIAKAIVKITNSPELRKAFVSYDRSMLVADVRRKESYKPGDSKARAKRQKSYR